MRIRIDNLEDLKSAADVKCSVVCPGSHCWEKPTPAAFMINQNGGYLLSLLRGGMYIYKREIKLDKMEKGI